MFERTDAGFIFKDSSYEFSKKLVQVILPAISSLYFGLGKIWGFPAVEEIVGSIAVFTTFLGVILGVSSSNYERSEAGYDGQMVVLQSPNGKKTFSLELDGSPEEIENKPSVSFKVKSTA